MRHPWSIARRIAAAMLLLFSAIALLSGWAAYLQARQTAIDVEARHVLGVASLVAQDEAVVRAAVSPAAAQALQGRIPTIMDRARVSWMTVMDPSGMRVASWRPDQVGVPYPLPVDRALAGDSWTEVSTTGAAGRSVRAVVPVHDPATGDVVGVLTMGVQVSELEIVTAAQLPRLALSFALTAAVGALTAYAVGRYLHRVTLGRGPEDLAEAFLLSEAAMDAMGAGVVVLSPDGRVRQHNAAAGRLLGLPAREETGAAARSPCVPAALEDALDRHPEAEFTGELDGRLVVVQQRRVQRPAPRRGGALALAAREGVAPAPAGTRVVVLHDRTDLQRLSDDLALSHTLTAALRAQTHEHANQLHTALALVDAGRLEAARGVLSRHRRPDEDADDVVTALLEAKQAQAAERGVTLEHAVRLDAPVPLPALDLVTVVGNLVDNALDAAAGGPADGRWVDVSVTSDVEGLVVQVADGGPGPEAGPELLFEPGYSTKPAPAAGRGVGLALVRSTALAAGGAVDVATDSGTVFTVEVPATEGPGCDGEAAP